MMKHRLLIAAFPVIMLAFCLAGCTEQPEQVNSDQVSSDVNAFGDVFFLNSFEELLQKKQETIKNIESLGGKEALMRVQDKEGNYITMKERDFNLFYDPVKLTSLNYVYVPAYLEKLRRLCYIMVVDSNIAVGYFSNNPEAKIEDVALEMSRESEYAEARMKWRIEEYDLKPWQEADGVYYEDVKNSSADVIQFYFLSDGECFFMPVSRELIDEIRQTDPEALNGALFELRKIDL